MRVAQEHTRRSLQRMAIELWSLDTNYIMLYACTILQGLGWLPCFAGLEAALNLPAGHTIAPTSIFNTDTSEGYYLTLTVYENVDALEGLRAEWSVFVDNGNGRHRTMVIELHTEDAALDSVSMLNLPSDMSHALNGNILNTQISTPSIVFDAAFASL